MIHIHSSYRLQKDRFCVCLTGLERFVYDWDALRMQLTIKKITKISAACYQLFVIRYLSYFTQSNVSRVLKNLYLQFSYTFVMCIQIKGFVVVGLVVQWCLSPSPVQVVGGSIRISANP